MSGLHTTDCQVDWSEDSDREYNSGLRSDIANHKYWKVRPLKAGQFLAPVFFSPLDLKKFPPPKPILVISNKTYHAEFIKLSISHLLRIQGGYQKHYGQTNQRTNTEQKISC